MIHRSKSSLSLCGNSSFVWWLRHHIQNDIKQSYPVHKAKKRDTVISKLRVYIFALPNEKEKEKEKEK